MNHQLKQLAHLIKSNQRDEAHQALSQYVAEYPDDAWGWYLHSFTTPETPEKITAAQRALALNPTSEKIQARLVQLQAVETPRTGNRLKMLLPAALLGMTIMAVVGAILLSQNQTSSRQLPTLVALEQSTSATTATEQAVAAEVTQNLTPTRPGAAVVAQESAPLIGTPSLEAPANSPTPVVEEGRATSQTLNNLNVITVSGATATSPSLVVSSLNATTAPEVTSVPQVTTESDSAPVATTAGTQIAVPSATPIPVQPTSPVVIVVENGAPLNTALNVGIGEMRVINATRPAESYIREMGGTMPAAPANQSWVLVEILVICQNASACAAQPSGFSVVGSTGVAYSASSQLTIDPILGSASTNGQLWGYVGFVVPNSESRLNLVLSQNNQRYVFSLQ